jgi:hypothetical protein
MNGLIAIAAFFWFMTTLLSYIFATDSSEPFTKRISHSIRLDFRRCAGLKVIPSIFQAIAIYWIILGIIVNWVGGVWLKGFKGDMIIVAIVGIPLLAVAILAGERKDKGL